MECEVCKAELFWSERNGNLVYRDGKELTVTVVAVGATGSDDPDKEVCTCRCGEAIWEGYRDCGDFYPCKDSYENMAWVDCVIYKAEEADCTACNGKADCTLKADCRG